MQNGCKPVFFKLVMLIKENCEVLRYEGGFLNASTPALLSVLVEGYVIPGTSSVAQGPQLQVEFTAIVIKVPLSDKCLEI